MSRTRNVAVLIGSLRREAISRKLAETLIELAPAQLEFSIVEIGGLPLYNEDLDDEKEKTPAAWGTFRGQIADKDAVLFVTPEYNRSIPGGLKNALDVGSRPYGQSVWNEKPAAIVSHSPGAISGFGANHHLRQALVFLNMPPLQQPEAYIGNSAALFDDSGKFSNDSTRDFLTKFLQAFADWIARTGKV